MVRWHGGISKHKRVATVPQAAVFFDRLDNNRNSVGTVRLDVGLPHLGALRIGSIWRDGTCRAQVKLERFDATVNFSTDGWCFVSARDFHAENNLSLIPPDVFVLPYKNRERSWFLSFSLPDGASLLVPSIEFFSRCYARTVEVNRVIATYGWEEVEKRLFRPITEPVEPGTWPVKLCARAYSADAVFLAHMWHDPEARLAIKGIYAGLDANFGTTGEPAFLKAGPWHRGKATLIIQGLRLDERRFLGLRILGCSDPIGDPVVMDRENAATAEKPAPDDAPGSAWRGAPTRASNKSPEIVDLTDDDDPDHPSSTLELNDPDFIVPGERRVVRTVRREQAKTRSGPRGDSSKTNTYSAGERRGSPRGTGRASIHSERVMESHGALRDIWNALVHAKRMYPHIIKAVDWYAPNIGFSDDDEPKIVALQPFDHEADPNLPTPVRNWPYLDVDARRLRGVLVARITTDTTVAYILEIERRIRRSKTNEKSGPSEEQFQGLIASPPMGEAIETWLHPFLSRIRHVKGVVKHLLGICPRNSSSFNHTSSKDDAVPMQAAAVNALKKVGIELTPQR